MTGELSRGLARWKYNGGKDAAYPQLDEKTLGALLQLRIEYVCDTRSIGGRLWSADSGLHGVTSEIPPLFWAYSNLDGKNGREQCVAGSLSGALSSKRVTEEPTKVG